MSCGRVPAWIVKNLGRRPLTRKPRGTMHANAHHDEAAIGGELVSPIVRDGRPREPLIWSCAFGHIFAASPFLILGGGHWCPDCTRDSAGYERQAERNSSSSSIPAIEGSFTAVQELGAHTVLAPVASDLLEPSEGTFDFTLLDRMIDAARERGLRLIPLWFGSWKNAVSTYVPAWVKTNVARFPRSELSDGSRAEQVTPFGMAARDADARAFAALLRHIRDVDADRTVIAVQVENEIGLLGDSRDRSAGAERAFAARVPAAVVEAIAGDQSAPIHSEWLDAGARREGTWAEIFPRETAWTRPSWRQHSLHIPRSSPQLGWQNTTSPCS